MRSAKKFFADLKKALQDASVVGFKISVTLHRDGNEEPKSVSIIGERSADGGWNTRSDRRQKSTQLASPAALREELLVVERTVRSYIEDNTLDDEWSEMQTALTTAMKSDVSVDDLENRSEAPVRAIAKYGYDAHLYAPLMAIAYVIDGRAALDAKDLQHASYCVERGHYWSSTEMLILDPHGRFADRARAGGQGKAGKYEPVMAKAAQLLRELVPDGGWSSSQAAAERVAAVLSQASYDQRVDLCGLEAHNLPRTIRGWIKEKPELFPHHIRPKGRTGRSSQASD